MAVTDDEVVEWIKETIPRDYSGQIIPTQEALEQVERRRPTISDAEKWRLAQAATIINAAKRAGIEDDVRRILPG